MAFIKLYDSTVYRIADYATQNSFAIHLDSITATEVLKNLTEENLSEIQFITDGGAVTGTYRNKSLCGYVDHGDTLAVSVNDADLCRYGLVLDDESRIISAVQQRYAPNNAIIVDNMPDGNYSDYLYVDEEFIYDPLPEPEQPEQTPTPEERITALEQQLLAAKILLGVE